jgi:hypothetical protein
MFIGNDKISKTVNVSDSDGGNLSELSDDTCKVNSPFSSSSSSRSEEQEFSSQNLAEARKRTSRALLLDYWILRPIIHTPYKVSVQTSRVRFLALLTMF